MPSDERVLCIPASHLEAVGGFHGFRAADSGYLSLLLDPSVFSFRPRREVEEDPSFKQLIPYVVLTCGERVFHYRRTGRWRAERSFQMLNCTSSAMKFRH